MGIFKNKEEAKIQAKEQSESQKCEEKDRNLLRTAKADASENQTAYNGIRKHARKPRTKTEKIALAIGFTGAFTMASTIPFSVTAFATGAMSTAAISAVVMDMFYASFVMAAAMYGTFIYGRMSKKSEQKKGPTA